MRARFCRPPARASHPTDLLPPTLPLCLLPAAALRMPCTTVKLSLCRRLHRLACEAETTWAPCTTAKLSLCRRLHRLASSAMHHLQTPASSIGKQAQRRVREGCTGDVPHACHPPHVHTPCVLITISSPVHLSHRASAVPSSNPPPLVSWFEPEESTALLASRVPFRTGACPQERAHASARHEAGHNLTTPYHFPCRSWPQSHSMSAQSLQRASAVWRITERHGVRLAARERIRAASMRARASRMAAAGREHAESLTSPLLVALPLAEC